MTEENSTESELIESVTDADSNIRLREAFELFDADKDGEITLDELQKVNNNKDRKMTKDNQRQTTNINK